jgi:hypothetical protein
MRQLWFRSQSVLMVPIFDESEGLYYRVEVWHGDRVDLLLAKCGPHRYWQGSA